MPALVLNTCGTSLLTGGKISDELRTELRQYANAATWDDMPADVAHRIKQHAKTKEAELLGADETTVRRLSAELNGLLSWQAGHTPNAQDTYLLLATDTALGQKTAYSIKTWLESKGHTAQIISADGLRTSSLNGFREALSGLVKELVETFEGYQASGVNIYFNLTGGFKGLNGFLQALSTIYADQTFYLFEGSKELLFIPKLPFTLDAEKIIQANLATFRRLAQGLTVQAADYKQIPDTLLFHVENEVMLSEWGELLWLSAYKALYKKDILPSISERVIYSENFEASTKGMPAHLLEIINTRIAALAEYTENDCKNALKSLDPKPLQEQRHKDAKRWECDLDSHHRIFMIKDGYTFTLEKVDKAFH